MEGELIGISEEILRWGISVLCTLWAIGLGVRAGIIAQAYIYLGGGEREIASLLKWLLGMVLLLIIALLANPLTEGLLNSLL